MPLTFLSWFLIPLIIPIIVLCLSEDKITQKNAQEAINFHISFFAYYALVLILTFLLFGLAGFILLPILFAPLITADYMLPIIGIVRCSTHLNRVYRYPFIFQIV